MKEAEISGVLTVYDTRFDKEDLVTSDLERCQKRFSPASTYKIPHALFALDAGVVNCVEQTFVWDGKKRFHLPWNQDHTLKSAIQHSTVWVFEEIAKELKGVAHYLHKLDYGNANSSGKKPYWIRGELRVSAMEQLFFLKQLYENELPFALEHQQVIKECMFLEVNSVGAIYGKTGWNGKVAWWIGWIQMPEGAVFVILNYDTPNGLNVVEKRDLFLEQVWQGIGNENGN